MDPIKFKKFTSFSDQVKTLSKINGTGDCGFLIIKKNNNEVIFRKDALSFMDLNVIKYIVVFCTKIWKSSGYTNSSYMLLGMFDRNFEQVDEIPCSKGAIVDVKFTKYPNNFPSYIGDNSDIPAYPKLNITTNIERNLYFL